MKNVINFEVKKSEKEKTAHLSLTIKEIAERAANSLFKDIMTMPEETIKALSVIKEIAIKNHSDLVTYSEFVENLPQDEREYALEHINELEFNQLIFSEVLLKEDGSEELHIHVFWY